MNVNIKLRDRDDINIVFNLIYKFTIDEGGDGATLVYCSNPEQMANMYDNARKSLNMPWGSSCHIKEGNLFTNKSNENILFTSFDDRQDYSDIFWENKFWIDYK